MKDIVRAWWRAMWAAIVYLISFKWLFALLELIRDLLRLRNRNENLEDSRRGRREICAPDCAPVRPDVYRRADPLIYSQSYLREQGLAVTWNNPDIQLFLNGAPVSSSALQPDTDYEVAATIWNNSTDAPAVNMPVEFLFFGFGIGTAGQAIDTDVVTVPVKGAPGHPARSTVVWHTPAAPGHYCLQARLHWQDDANPKNNVGQENTNVVEVTSPAVATFPVRNDANIPRQIRLEADSYTIPPKRDCRERDREREKRRKHNRRKELERATRQPVVPPSERDADWAEARHLHGSTAHPIPPGWHVQIQPDVLDLDAFAEQNVIATITPPDSFAGEQVLNINAYYGIEIVGGVTLTVVKS